MKKTLKVVTRKIEDLISAEYNPRWIEEASFDHLKDSLKRFDAVDPAIINMHPSRENIIIGGHQRIRAALALGWKTFPCVELSLDRDKERELNIRLNKNTGSWDWDELAANFDTEELMDWGFDEEELFGKFEFNDEKKSKKDLSDSIESMYKIEIECSDEAEMEKTYNKLKNEGYACRILIL